MLEGHMPFQGPHIEKYKYTSSSDLVAVWSPNLSALVKMGEGQPLML